MGRIEMDNFSDLIDERFYTVDSGRIYNDIINDIEKTVIIKALTHSCGNCVRAAKILGMHRNTLNNKIKKFDIDVRGFKK